MVPDASSLLPIALAALLGLVVGSFVNVLIHRLPLMLERDWLAGHESTGEAPPALPAPLALARQHPGAVLPGPAGALPPLLGQHLLAIPGR